MAFQRVKYELDSGQITQIRLSEEKIALAGTPPAGNINLPGWNVSATGSRRQRNRRIARGWVYQFAEETTSGDLTATVSYFFPKLTPSAYNASAPATLDYDNRTLTFVDKRAEG